MVDLPTIPLAIPEVRAPQSRVSGENIAHSSAQLAHSLEKASEVLSRDVAVPLAKQAGLTAVTRDAEGNVTVERAPIVGDAAIAYAHAMKLGAVSSAETEAKIKNVEIRNQFRDDPSGYLKAMDGYRKAMVEKYRQVGKEAQFEIGTAIQRMGAETYRGLANEKENIDLRRVDEAIKADIESTGDEMESLARRGGITAPDGGMRPEFSERFAKVNNLLNQRVNNPRLAYPREKADQYLDALSTRVNGAAVIEQTERIYHERGFDAARNYLRRAVKNLEGKVKQLDKIEDAGMKFLRSEEAMYRGDRMLIGSEWSSARPQAATLPRDALLAMRDRSILMGNHRVASDIDAHISALDFLAAIPPADRAVVVTTGMMPASLTPQQRAVQSEIEREARAQGVDPRLATSVGFRESALGANMVSPTSSARGVFQLTQANRTALGLPENAPLGDQVRAGVGFLKQTTDELRTSLGREPTAAEVYMGHFQGAGAATAIIRAAPDASLKSVLDSVKPNFRGPDGETWGETVIKANPSLQNTPTVGAFRQWAGRVMGAEAGIDLTETRGGLIALQMIKKDMAHQLTDEIKNLRSTVAKAEFPPLDQVMALGEKVYSIGTPEQKREVSEIVAISKVGQEFMNRPATERAQWISEADAELKAGAERFDARLRDAMRKTDRDITAAYDKDAYGAFYRFSRSPVAKPTPMIDLAAPQNIPSILDMRVKQQAVIRAEQGIGVKSALRPDEQAMFRSMLARADTTGDVAPKLAIFDVLAKSLPDDIRIATLASLGQEGPDAMVSAYAGALLRDQRNVAEGILRGQMAMKAEPKRYNALTDKNTFNEAFDKALPPLSFPETDRINAGGMRATLRSAVLARYADLSARAGQLSESIDEKRLAQSINDVTGGTVIHNGRTIIAPKRGMTQPQFDNVIWNLSDTDLGIMTDAAGRPITASHIRHLARLEHFGEGRYLVRLGSGDGAGYAIAPNEDYGTAGPAVLDLYHISTDRRRTPRGTPRGTAEAYRAMWDEREAER